MAHRRPILAPDNLARLRRGCGHNGRPRATECPSDVDPQPALKMRRHAKRPRPSGPLLLRAARRRLRTPPPPLHPPRAVAKSIRPLPRWGTTVPLASSKRVLFLGGGRSATRRDDPGIERTPDVEGGPIRGGGAPQRRNAQPQVGTGAGYRAPLLVDLSRPLRLSAARLKRGVGDEGGGDGATVAQMKSLLAWTTAERGGSTPSAASARSKEDPKVSSAAVLVWAALTPPAGERRQEASPPAACNIHGCGHRW